MTISVRGIGWLTGAGYGCVAAGQEFRFEEGQGINTLAKQGLFSHPFRNFGRLDLASRMTCTAVALALRDAGIPYSPQEKQEIGIMGASSLGSLVSDTTYFNDYIDNGRTLARGNLFIYTLPSSPLGEAAIHFGLTGPLLFATGRADSFGASMTMAAEMVAGAEARRMLVGWLAPDEALYAVLDREQGGEALCGLGEAQLIVASAGGVTEQVRRFSILQDTKGKA
ncbi:MAG: hypothetical protein HXX11_10875 [Desulfuromonadales bacterium]|nr:hypothetical protein [Desulfuromonadales bacterium]